MAQKITTSGWTQITGLESAKTYIIQALLKPSFGASDTVFGYMPTKVMWLQSASAPQSTDIGVIDSQIKVSGSTNVYINAEILPVEIAIQEII